MIDSTPWQESDLPNRQLLIRAFDRSLAGELQKCLSSAIQKCRQDDTQKNRHAFRDTSAWLRRLLRATNRRMRRRRIERHLTEVRLLPGQTLDRFAFKAVMMISTFLSAVAQSGGDLGRLGSTILYSMRAFHGCSRI